MKLIEFNFKNNLLLYIFFSIYLIIGLIIYKDYSISFDEDLHRMNGFISFQYILNFFSIPYDLNEVIRDIPDIKTDWRRTYGVAFDLPLAFIETFFKINDSKSIYLLRHLFTFLIFFSSTICFYHLINLNFKNKNLCLLGVSLLILSPRIFGDSFYNSRDIIFLSFVIFTTYYSLKALNEEKIKYIVLASLFASLSANTRVLGCFIPIMAIFFYYLNCKGEEIFKKTFKFSFFYIFFFLLFLFISWPYLWENPFRNFFASFSEFSNYPFDIYILYLGEYINSKYVPWHYFFVWFFITTPILYIFFIIIGLFYVLRIFVVNFINIDEKNDFLLWKNNSEMNELFILLVFLIPIFILIVLNSTLYTGWRHLYFVYPSLIFIAVKGIDNLLNLFPKPGKILIYLCLIVQIIFVTNDLVKMHPVQAVYFNSVSKNIINNTFFYDYWGLGNKLSLEKLLNNKKYSKPIKIATSSLTDLNKTKLIMDSEKRDEFIFLGTNKQDADFIFTNYYYNVPPDTDNKFLIPKNYDSIIKLEIGGLLINEIYEKK